MPAILPNNHEQHLQYNVIHHYLSDWFAASGKWPFFPDVTLFRFYIPFFFKRKIILTSRSIMKNLVNIRSSTRIHCKPTYMWDARLHLGSQDCLWHCAEFLETTNERRGKGNFYLCHSEDYKPIHKRVASARPISTFRHQAVQVV